MIAVNDKSFDGTERCMHPVLYSISRKYLSILCQTLSNIGLGLVHVKLALRQSIDNVTVVTIEEKMLHLSKESKNILVAFWGTLSYT